MKTAEMIAKILTSPEKDTVVKINLNPKAFYYVNMLLGHYFRYSEIPEQAPYEFVNDIGIYLLQQGFLNTLTRPVFDLKPLVTVDDGDTVAFTQNMIYQGNLIVDGKMCVLLYDYGEILPKGYLSRLATTPTCIIICNSFDDRALIFCQYIEEQSRTVKSVIRTNITSSEIHLIPRCDGLTAEAIAAIVKLVPPQKIQLSNTTNYNTGEDRSLSAHLQHYACQHNILGGPSGIGSLFGIRPHFNPAFQPNHNTSDLNEMRRFIQQLQNDLIMLANRLGNIEAKVFEKTDVAADVPPTVDAQPQPDKDISKDTPDTADIHTRTIRGIIPGNLPIANNQQLVIQPDALATELAKISQRLDHLENTIYNKTKQ